MLNANRCTIVEIFNGGKLLDVPFFQRSYVWGEPQWERLLDDLETVTKMKQMHFIGSVILKQQQTDTTSVIGDIRTLIDGQQRLTTLTILLKVLCLKTKAMSKFNKRFRLGDDDEFIALQHNRNDIKAFNRIMDLEELEDIQAEDNISKAYTYFRENLCPEKLDFNTVCNCLVFVAIDLSHDEDEQQIFDTINSLGVKLTTAELLKNYFFGRSDIALYEKYWLEIFEKDDDTKAYWDTEFNVGNQKRTFVDQFFFAFLQIKIQDSALNVTGDDKIAYAKLEHLFDSYKKFVARYCNNERHALLDEISEYAKTFRNAINIDVVDRELPACSGIERITAIVFHLETTTLLPYVLFIEQNLKDDSTKNELYGCLESYIMRRICCRQSTKGYSRLFGSTMLLNRVLSKDDFIKRLGESEEGASQMPSDDDLINAFHVSSLTNKQAGGVLYMIESKIRDRDRHSTQLHGISKYSLEHLMPKKWRNHWAFSGDSLAASLRDKKLLTLGNLAIITQTLNGSIKDADWKTKKAGKADKGGLEACSHGLETLAHALKHDEWNEKTIQERATWLCEKALEAWAIDRDV